MSSRDLPNPIAALQAGTPMPSGLSQLLAEAERDGALHGRRLGWLDGLKTGLLLGVPLGGAAALLMSCGIPA